MATSREARSNVIQGTRKRDSHDLFQRLPDPTAEVESERTSALLSARVSLEGAEESTGIVVCSDTGTKGPLFSEGEMSS
jgi:hypothetical protein